MIDNPAVEDLLNRIGHPLHLTGSRYMMQHRPDSDWDFVGEYSSELYYALLDLGFSSLFEFEKDGVPIQYNGGLDGHTYDLLEYEVAGETIQIQLTDCLHGKLFARDTIAQHFRDIHLAMNNKKRGQLWKKLINMYAKLYPKSVISIT